MSTSLRSVSHCRAKIVCYALSQQPLPTTPSKGHRAQSEALQLRRRRSADLRSGPMARVCARKKPQRKDGSLKTSGSAALLRERSERGAAANRRYGKAKSQHRRSRFGTKGGNSAAHGPPTSTRFGKAVGRRNGGSGGQWVPCPRLSMGALPK